MSSNIKNMDKGLERTKGDQNIITQMSYTYRTKFI